MGALAGAGLLVLLVTVGFATHLRRGGSLEFVNLGAAGYAVHAHRSRYRPADQQAGAVH